jgi:hypothetical protein
MHAAVSRQLPALRELCRRFGVVRLEVFGSAARAWDFDPTRSDADFLVEFDRTGGVSALEQFFGLSEELTRLLQRPVDLVEAGAVRNPYLLAQIERTRELVYAA